MLKIRLARAGSKKRPYYRIVVADARAPRDGKYVEKIGSYNPMLPKDDEKRVILLEDRIKYWLGEGAQPTDRIAIFLGNAGIADKPVFNNPNKAKPSEKTLERNKEKEEKLATAKEAAEAAKAEEKEVAKATKEAEKTAKEDPKEEA